ncbi:MAG: hypothetical protein AB2801_03535 [Candidatus Thiodiazotropha endolucinida]
MYEISKKSPDDVSEFEREQLRFFLANRDISMMLSVINPSFAWLSMLIDLNLLDTDKQVIPWIENNFKEISAIQEVAANIGSFDEDAAEIIDSRLNRTDGVPQLLMKCWRLIIRHLRSAKKSMLRSEWFEIEPRIKGGELSREMLERLAHVLRPKLRVGKPYSYLYEETDQKPERITDIISIDYEVEGYITADDVIAAWPENVSAESDEKLLELLSNELNSVLEEAAEVCMDHNFCDFLTNSDVPSVAHHEQNDNRSGFLHIVRVIADLWTHLAHKDSERALLFVEKWCSSPHRLMRRLAVYAAADTMVPAYKAADLLIELPASEFSHRHTSVEIYRLIKSRWLDFSTDKQRDIERRFIEGPPSDGSQEDHEKWISRSRFDLLGYLQNLGFQLNEDAYEVLDEIHNRWPDWQLIPEEQAGFQIWHESKNDIDDNSKILNGVLDKDLIDQVEKLKEEAGYLEVNDWGGLFRSNASRALRGLAFQASEKKWPTWAWRSLLQVPENLQEKSEYKLIGRMLLDWPEDTFTEIISNASWWLKESVNNLEDDLIWPLWDRIEGALPKKYERVLDNDVLSTSINDPSGYLVDVVLKMLDKEPKKDEIPQQIYERLDKLVNSDGEFGRLARINLISNIPYLFNSTPEWSREKLIPHLHWSSPDAAAAWSARKYSKYIGPPELFGLTKQPFLQLFIRADVPDEELRVFAGWLVVIMLANQSDQGEYPLSSVEVRSALRQAGAGCLPSVAHRLAIEMNRAKSEEKQIKWREEICPVFQSIWPLDIELQSSASTTHLVHILRSSGAAFKEAAEVIIPFIRPDTSRGQTSVYSISTADDEVFSSSPERLLDLVVAIVGDSPARAVHGLKETLDRIKENAPLLANTRKFQKMLRYVVIN